MAPSTAVWLAATDVCGMRMHAPQPSDLSGAACVSLVSPRRCCVWLPLDRTGGRRGEARRGEGRGGEGSGTDGDSHAHAGRRVRTHESKQNEYSPRARGRNLKEKKSSRTRTIGVGRRERAAMDRHVYFVLSDATFLFVPSSGVHSASLSLVDGMWETASRSVSALPVSSPRPPASCTLQPVFYAAPASLLLSHDRAAAASCGNAAALSRGKQLKDS